MPYPTAFPYPHWYLDTVCGEGQWKQVDCRDEGGRLTGILPFYRRKKWGIPILTPPPLAPRLGPWLFKPDSELKPAQQLDFQHKVLIALAHQLPKVAYARINWPYHLTYGLPWQELGWEQTVRYSYCIDLLQPQEAIWQNFKSSLRNKVRKAEKGLRIRSATDPQELARLVRQVFIHRQDQQQLSEAFIGKVVQAAFTHKSGHLWEAFDELGRVHGALFLILDSSSAYNLLLGTDPSLRQSGAAPFLLWHAIQFAKDQGLTTFDFEGSQLPGVESFFRSFGGEARPYYQFTKMKWWVKMIR